MNRPRRLSLAAGALALLATAFAPAQDRPKLGYKDTPMLPGGKWHVHDGDRPQPPIVTPGTASTQDAPGSPPSDAVVLFDGKDLSRWRNGKGESAGWKVEDGAMVGAPGAGDVLSKDEFGDCQLHVEWASPKPARGSDQGRGNSGIMFFGRYEMQVLDNYQNVTYPDGQAGSVYGQTPPLVNASRPPGQWQTYDIAFTAPRFKEDGSVATPAYVTLFHNGVLVQNHTELLGPMTFRGLPKYRKHGEKGPILLQDHGNPVRYRNIWAREIKSVEQP